MVLQSNGLLALGCGSKRRESTIYIKYSELAVGSSNSSKSGSVNRARASTILENDLVFLHCTSGVKLRPSRIDAARASAASASTGSSHLYISSSLLLIASLSHHPCSCLGSVLTLPHSLDLSRWASSCISWTRSTSAFSAHCKAVVSSPVTSCSTCNIWQFLGIPSIA